MTILIKRDPTIAPFDPLDSANELPLQRDGEPRRNYRDSKVARIVRLSSRRITRFSTADFSAVELRAFATGLILLSLRSCAV
jgi:hypothetical protein